MLKNEIENKNIQIEGLNKDIKTKNQTIETLIKKILQLKKI